MTYCKTIALFTIFVCSLTATAQLESLEKKPFKKQYFIRTNFLSLIEPEGGITLGFRYKWARRLSATIDPTLIFFGWDGFRNPPYGLRIRADFRYNVVSFSASNPDGGFFIAPELQLKSISQKQTSTFGVDCIGNNCSYRQTANYTINQKEIGGVFKSGINIPFGRNDPKMSMEFYGGVGLRFFFLKAKNITPNNSVPLTTISTFTDFFRNGRGAEELNLPGVLLAGGFKLSYRIN
jgi:hypothetical protein